MKVAKKILLGLLVIVALLLIAGLFMDKNYAVTREIVINRPKQEVFDYIKHLKNQDNFRVWATMDPSMKKNYTGTDATVGFVSAWESDNEHVGKGEQEIKKITEGERVDFELRFIEPFESTEKAFMMTEALSPTQTKVKWGFEGDMSYPMNIMLYFMNFDETLGRQLQTGLDNLKKKLE